MDSTWDMGQGGGAIAADVAGRESFVGLAVVAQFLGVAPRTIQRWIVNSERFPVYRFGRALRFRISEVERWARQNRVRHTTKG